MRELVRVGSRRETPPALSRPSAPRRDDAQQAQPRKRAASPSPAAACAPLPAPLRSAGRPAPRRHGDRTGRTTRPSTATSPPPRPAKACVVRLVELGDTGSSATARRRRETAGRSAAWRAGRLPPGSAAAAPRGRDRGRSARRGALRPPTGERTPRPTSPPRRPRAGRPPAGDRRCAASRATVYWGCVSNAHNRLLSRKSTRSGRRLPEQPVAEPGGALGEEDRAGQDHPKPAVRTQQLPVSLAEVLVDVRITGAARVPRRGAKVAAQLG